MRGKGTKKLCDLKLVVEGKRGVNGRRLCVWCHQEVPKRRRNWCSDKCVDEYRQQADWTYLCRLVRKRDKGICAQCGLDTVALRKTLREMGRECGRKAARQHAATLRIPTYRATGRLYDVDHLIPCAEGGVDSLENLRTLCIPCHRAETTALQRRLAENRKKHDDK